MNNKLYVFLLISSMVSQSNAHNLSIPNPKDYFTRAGLKKATIAAAGITAAVLLYKYRDRLPPKSYRAGVWFIIGSDSFITSAATATPPTPN